MRVFDACMVVSRETKMAETYTYKCRECLARVRVMCIQEAQISPGAKRILERAFESHTDTEATWALLQKNCLLLRRDELVIDDPRPAEQGLLGRMRKQEQAEPSPENEPAPPRRPVRAEREGPPVVSAPPEPEPPPAPAARGGLLARLQQRESESDGETPVVTPPATAELEERRRDRRARQAQSRARRRPETTLRRRLPPRQDIEPETGAFAPASSSERVAEPQITPDQQTRPSLLDRLRSRDVSGPPGQPSTDELLHLRKQLGKSALVEIRYPPPVRPAASSYQAPGPKMLVVESTGHRILLPENGELVFGRLDPLAQIKPDIDMTFEDRPNRGISRRHATVNGWHGRYEVTDLGSGNGTWVNGSRIDLQRTVILQVGDEVRLGNCALFLDRALPKLLSPPADGHFFFYATFGGRFYPLPDKDVITIGRADPVLGFTPDIDLSDQGDASTVVSRHHVKLFRHGNQFSVEDLGSAFKTKIDGQPVYVGTRAPIQPGQHLWLGGCVLAFDLV